MTMDVMLSVRDVDLTYRIRKSFFRSDSVAGLCGVSFDLYRGETLGVLGRNGSGKSTLLRLLAGIYEADKGAVISNADSISLMTLALGLDRTLTGRKNAIFGGMLLGASRDQVAGSLESIKSFSGLGDAFEEPIKSYSMGMLSRLAFSIAVNLTPDVLLLDEVLAVGDQQFREKAYDAMEKKITSEQTAVLVSHSMSEIERLCNRAILLDRGQIVAIGDVAQVVDAYQALLEAS